MQGQHLRWSYLSTIMTVALQLLAATTITRFLQPRDYGLAALALLCTNLAAYFTQLGVGRALVQKASVTHANIQAAYTLALATGFAGTILLFVMAPLIGEVLHDLRLTPVIKILAFNLLFQSAALVTGGLLRRTLRMRTLAVCDASAYALSTFCVGLPLAITKFGVWALVASTVSQSLFQGIFYFIARPHPLSPMFSRSAYRGVAAFSGKTFVTTAIEASGCSLDVAVIGRLLGAASVGLYGRSLTLSTQPCFQFSMGLTRVFAPSLAKTMHTSDRANAVGAVLHAEQQLMSVIIPLCVSAAVCAPTLVPLIFGAQWRSAIPIYRALCIVAAFDSSFDIPALYLEIANRFRSKLVLQTSFFALLLIATLLVAPAKGLLGVALVFAVAQAARSYCFHCISAHSLGVRPSLLLGSWYPGIICSAATATVLFTVQHLLSAGTIGQAIARACCLALCAALTSGVVYYFLFHDTIYQTWREVFCHGTATLSSLRQTSATNLTEDFSTCAS